MCSIHVHVHTLYTQRDTNYMYVDEYILGHFYVCWPRDVHVHVDITVTVFFLQKLHVAAKLK